MIYRIEPDLNVNNLGDLLEKASSLGNLCYSLNSIFIQSDKSLMEIEVIFQNCEVENIPSSYDLSACSEMVRHWCNTIWSEEALKRFEDSEDGQNRMKYIMSALDQLEEKRRKEAAEGARSKDQENRTETDSGSGGESLETSL